MSNESFNKRVGLDVDGVLANFPKGVLNEAKARGMEDQFPVCCHDVCQWGISPSLSDVMRDEWSNPNFWLQLEPMEYSLPMDFTPIAYITARPIDSWVTRRWLHRMGFPKAEVITVKNPVDKLLYARSLQLDLFVDDYYPTVEHFIENGANAVLMNAPYQKGEIGLPELPTIYSLGEIRRRPELFKTEDK